MIKVVITAAEAAKAQAPWPGATAEQRLAYLMRSKGLRFRFSIDPKPTDLMEPWYAFVCSDTGDMTIEQGGSEALDLAVRYQERAHDLHLQALAYLSDGHWLAAQAIQEDCAKASLKARQIMGIE